MMVAPPVSARQLAPPVDSLDWTEALDLRRELRPTNRAPYRASTTPNAAPIGSLRESPKPQSTSSFECVVISLGGIAARTRTILKHGRKWLALLGADPARL